MLSIKQNELLENLKNTFETINTSLGNSTSLINVINIKDAYNKDEADKAELALIRKQYAIIGRDLANSWATKLSAELEGLGVKCVIWGNNEQNLQFKALDDTFCSDSITPKIYFETKTTDNIPSGFKFSIYFSPNKSEKFDSLEEILADERFTTQLKYLYGHLQSHKK